MNPNWPEWVSGFNLHIWNIASGRDMTNSSEVQQMPIWACRLPAKCDSTPFSQPDVFICFCGRSFYSIYLSSFRIEWMNEQEGTEEMDWNQNERFQDFWIWWLKLTRIVVTTMANSTCHPHSVIQTREHSELICRNVSEVKSFAPVLEF